MGIVLLARCSSYEPKELQSVLRRIIEPLGGISRFVKPGRRVLLKPNMLSAHPPQRHVTTHPQVVEAVARLVIEAGATPVIGDSPALEGFLRVAHRSGIRSVASRLGLELVPFRRPTVASVPQGAIFKRLEIASEVLEADAVINLPKLKTHSQMLLTLAVKNLFGTIVGQRKAEWHHMAGVDRDTFASLHLDIYLRVRPVLNILDGIWGMEGHGPNNGIPRPLGIMAASTDAVALDVSICRLLGVPLGSFPLYRAAKARKIGEAEPDKVSYRGDPPQLLRPSRFQVPRLDSLGVFPKGLEGLTRRFLVSKPFQRAEACDGCGRCVRICPADALRLEGRRLGFDYSRCIRCYCCQEVCPSNAVDFKRGPLVRLMDRFSR